MIGVEGIVVGLVECLSHAVVGELLLDLEDLVDDGGSGSSINDVLTIDCLDDDFLYLWRLLGSFLCSLDLSFLFCDGSFGGLLWLFLFGGARRGHPPDSTSNNGDANGSEANLLLLFSEVVHAGKNYYVILLV